MQHELEYFLHKYEEEYNKKDYLKALAILEDGLKSFPSSFELYGEKSTIHHILKDYDKAFQSLNKLIELKPDHMAAYFRRGRWELDLGLYEEAYQDLTIVIESKNEYFLNSAYYFRSIVLFYLKKYEEALDDYYNIPDDLIYLGPRYPSKQEIYAKIENAIELEEKKIRIIKFD